MWLILAYSWIYQDLLKLHFSVNVETEIQILRALTIISKPQTHYQLYIQTNFNRDNDQV